MTIRALGADAPEIHPTAFVHETAEVIGKVRLGPGASVWPYAVLRGDIEEIVVGEGTNVQDAVVIHTDRGNPTVLGDGISVGHGAILHGCRVENHCLVGMGSIVLNGAVIEEGAMVGAGALVPPGARVTRGHLAVGVPAKVLRALRPEETEHIRKNAQNYAGYRERHAKDARVLGR